jgi:AcrR family transcriptional regulator
MWQVYYHPHRKSSSIFRRLDGAGSVGAVTARTTATPAALTFDENVSAVVRTLAAWRGATLDEVADATGVSPSSFYRRLRGGAPWLAVELDRLAHTFGVAPAVFYAPADDLIDHIADPVALDRRRLRRSTPKNACFTVDELRGSLPLADAA